ncbi:P-loop containing nucleoside triphosphate hydrolase protein [Panaeolus papilionaceus]|nr:P-loop containing nucleoside triphosphate hydrolase protein [Panaeolus papilionaceus]
MLSPVHFAGVPSGFTYRRAHHLTNISPNTLVMEYPKIRSVHVTGNISINLTCPQIPFVMNYPKLNRLTIHGDISINQFKPVTADDRIIPGSTCILIMGPTGSGKSSFIEALAAKSQQLSISKDQLAGYTQTVNCYEVINVMRDGRNICLVDTPGFSDSKISEVEIIDMIRKWMQDQSYGSSQRILYMMPISETRLPGSRRRTVEMLKQFLEKPHYKDSVTFVTTMWDTLHNKRARMRAESNFAQLRDQVLKDFPGEKEVSITRFMNTRNSALEILDMDPYSYCYSFRKPTSSALANLYQDLHQRIEGALQTKKLIESELTQPEVHTNAELRDILEQNQRENDEILTKFISQLINFGPIPFGFHQAAQCLRKSIAARVTPKDPQRAELFHQWEEEPKMIEEPIREVIPEPVPALDPNPSTESLPLSSRKLALKGLLRRLLTTAKHRGSKWFKRRP